MQSFTIYGGLYNNIFHIFTVFKRAFHVCLLLLLVIHLFNAQLCLDLLKSKSILIYHII